jgi:hypothetical protein
MLPHLQHVDAALDYNGARPIPRTITFCESCGEWLPTHIERKTINELIAALRLIHAVPELSAARLEHSDRPDVHLHLGGATYGLEVTRIARGGDNAIERVQWMRGVERIGRLLRRENANPPAWVGLHWNDHIPTADAEQVASLLNEVVQAMLPSTIGEMAHLDPRDLSDDVMKFVHAITIRRSRADDMWVSGYSNMPDVQPTELQAVIDGKAGVMADYSPDVSAHWLLMYGETTNAAQALDLNDEALEASYTAPFDRVFFVDCMDKAGELRLSRPARATRSL